jgi:hypothetical protein
MCNQIEREIKTRLMPMLASGKLPQPAVLRLTQRGAKTLVLVEGHQIEFNLGQKLFVPSL